MRVAASESLNLINLSRPALLPKVIGDVSSLDLGLRSRMGDVPLVAIPPAFVIIMATGVRR